MTMGVSDRQGGGRAVIWRGAAHSVINLLTPITPCVKAFAVFPNGPVSP